MRTIVKAFLWSLPFLFSATAADVPAELGKDTGTARWKMVPGAEWLQDGTLKVKADRSGRSLVSCSPDVRKFAGKFVRVSAQVKAEKVSVGKRPNHGVKVMVSRNSNGMGELWKASANRLWGSFDWNTQEVCLLVPEDVSDFRIHLGLENATGTAWFRRIAIRELEGDLYPAPVPLAAGFRCEYTDTVTRLPLLRGVCVLGSRMTPEAIRTLGKWRCNALRWWIEDLSLIHI